MKNRIQKNLQHSDVVASYPIPNMNFSIQIPRPSLSGSSTSTRSGSSTHSYSGESNSYLPVGTHATSARKQQQQRLHPNSNNQYKNNRHHSPTLALNNSTDRIVDKNTERRNQRDKFNKSMDDRFNYNARNDMIGKLKRGSRSSQGSTDSNNSSGTASSGSLLLTTANLERFAAIHNNTSKNTNINNINNINSLAIPSSSSIGAAAGATNQLLNATANSDINHHPNIYTIANNHINKINGNNNNRNHTNNGDNTTIEIDPNLHFIKTKDVDAVSIASSTHFTMVNGVGGPQRKSKSSGICSRGHQLTVLILTMSTFFLIGILLMVYLMEMRAREMPQM